eukprot:gene19660-21607_t
MVNNEKLYEFSFQEPASKKLELIKHSAHVSGSTKCAIFQASPYLFVIVAFSGNLYVVETHPINDSLGGNGNAVVVMLVRITCHCSSSTDDSKVEDTDPQLPGSSDSSSTSEANYINEANKSTVLGSDIKDSDHTINSESSDELEITYIKAAQCGYDLLISFSCSKSTFPRATGNINTEPDGEPYNGNVATPIFQRRKSACSAKEIISILLLELESHHLCTRAPLNVAHNVSFVIDTSCLKKFDDIKCDSMGSWKRTGSPLRLFTVENDVDGHVLSVCREDAKNERSVLSVKQIYYVNKSDQDVHKTISLLEDFRGTKNKNVLVHYQFANEEHPVYSLRPHGNSKGNTPYRRISPSTLQEMKSSILNKDLTAKEILDRIYCSRGDVLGAECLDELPRGPKDIYYARHDAKKKRESPAIDNTERKGGNLADNLWIMLERAKREEENSKYSIFIRECKVHPDLFLVLANNRQLKDLVTFCTNPREFSIFACDPTFNVLDTNLSLTVTTHRNLKLLCKKTNKSPVFIGPVMLHQSKIWKTNSNFAHTLITEQPELEGILACGTDGEKAFIKGLKRNFSRASRNIVEFLVS